MSRGIQKEITYSHVPAQEKLILNVFIQLFCPLHWNFLGYVPKLFPGSWYHSHCEHHSVSGDNPKT